MADITYEIKENLGVLSNAGAWETQVNLISWNHSVPKYDIRKWNTVTGKMSKGISLSEEEVDELLNILRERRDSDEEE